MQEYNLEFISDRDIFEHVKKTVMKYRSNINLKEFNKNLIDPIKLTFDSKVCKKPIEEILESEITRQFDKSTSNAIGYFHQNIFEYIGGADWIVLKNGYDIINERQKIYVEMKTKHNTMNSSSKESTYRKMQNTIRENSDARCMLVEVIAKNSQNIKWEMPDSDERIRRISIDKFYEIVTGDPFSFKKLCDALPSIIDDVVNSIESSTSTNTVVQELLEINGNISTNLYALAFKKYQGF
jgi:Eco47II restriction endonuclease